MRSSIIGVGGRGPGLVVRVGGSAIDIGEAVKILRSISDGGWYTYTEIVKRAGVSYSTVSKYIPFLERAGLVEVKPQGKAKYVRITEKGLQALALAERLVAMFSGSE